MAHSSPARYVAALTTAWLVAACGPKTPNDDLAAAVVDAVSAEHGRVSRYGVDWTTGTIVEVTLNDPRYRGFTGDPTATAQAIAKTTAAALAGRLSADSIRVTLVISDLNLGIYRSHKSSTITLAVGDLAS